MSGKSYKCFDHHTFFFLQVLHIVALRSDNNGISKGQIISLHKTIIYLFLVCFIFQDMSSKRNLTQRRTADFLCPFSVCLSVYVCLCMSLYHVIVLALTYLVAVAIVNG